MKTTRSAQRNGLIQRLAAAWIQEIGLQGFIGHPEALFEHPEVAKRIKRLSPATLGIIAWQGIAREDTGAGQKAEGRTALYDVHNGTWISKYAGGKDALRALAQTAIVCEVWDQLGRPYEDWHARVERLAEEEFDRGMRDYVHHGGNVPARS